MTPRKLRLAPLTLALAAAGCALGTQRFGREIDESRISSLEVGVSTKADVLAVFGPPTAYSHLPVADDEEERRKRERERGHELEPEPEPPPDAFVYQYREDRESFFTVLLFTRFRREVLTDRLIVFFDEQEVVRHLAFERETGE